jgi:predicted RNA-binding protein Jag
MKAWLKELVRKFLWLFASAKAKRDKAQADARLALEKANKESIANEQEKKKKEFEDYLQSLIKEGMKRGMDEKQATKWAWRKIEEKVEKNRLSGRLIACTVCKRAGCFHDTGGLRKNPDGKTYRHQNCGG